MPLHAEKELHRLARGGSRWRLRLGILLASIGLGLAILMSSALPAVADVRPAFLLVAAIAALLLAGTRSQIAGRQGRVLLVGSAALAGLGSMGAARDLWLVYRTEEVRFTAEPGVELAGTLYLPRKSGRRPAVVLVHGSGPETRHEGRFHARAFARAGLVALTYDKRGSGLSGGDRHRPSYERLADDVVTAVEMLRSRPEVDAARVGIWGVSEGEWVGVLAAAKSRPAFLVVVSPSAMTPSEQVRHETRANVLRSGFGEAAANRAADLYTRLAEFQRAGTGREELNRLLSDARSEPWFAAARYLEESVPEYERVLDLEWFPAWRQGMDLDVLPLYAHLDCPVLAQVGGDDPKNDGQAALDRIRTAVARGGNRRFTGLLYPSAGHRIIVWALPGHLPPPWFARGYLREQRAWVVRAAAGQSR